MDEFEDYTHTMLARRFATRPSAVFEAALGAMLGIGVTDRFHIRPGESA